ncbi:MAG: glycosyl hydrolase [Gemmatimonadetes bacterium]|nr:glycosyl hydrolase [Gemmatimonadota bacterium]
MAKLPSRVGAPLALVVAALSAAPAGAQLVQLVAVAGGAAPGEAAASWLPALKWRNIGPYRGGRSLAVVGDPANRNVFYFGSVGGGVWKTEDAGYSWVNVSDGFFRTGAVGAIAVAQSSAQVVYVGMGEVCIRGNISHGDGVYRSDDGGKTWRNLGLEKTRHIGRVRVHPQNPELVYVAALGDAWGANPERGVFRSRDGGRTWEKILFVNDSTGVVDLAMDATNPSVLYAAAWEAQRYPWGVRGGGPGSALYKTTDGGATWTKISANPGFPRGVLGRIGIALAPTRPSRLWAIVDAGEGQIGIYRTDDGGASWTLVANDGDLVTRPFYYSHIFADSQDPETVYVLNVGMYRSRDGGKTWRAVRTPHGDNHDLWVDPKDALRMIEANDGGATITFDAGRSWSSIYNQPTSQLYHVTTDTRFPYRVYGAQQDNSTIAIPSRSEYGAINESEWYSVGGGESGYIAVHPKDPDLVFAADHFWLSRYDHRTRDTKWVSVWPAMWYGWGARDVKYRFYWTYPVVFSPHEANTLYVTSQYVHRTRDEGNSWEVISPDLSRADTAKMEPTPRWGREGIAYYWGPTSRQTNGDHWYGMIFTFAESPVAPGVLWAGSDDGLVHVSRDGGKSWQNVTPKDLPAWALISIIEPSHHDAGAVYFAATRYKVQDRAPYLYRSSDYGKSWTRITNGIPDGDFTRVIRDDPQRRGMLYAGTETGVYVSFDDGAGWQPLRLNLPVVPIHDMTWKEGDLVVASHGRGFWILDDVALLHQLGPEVLAAGAHLFRPPTTVRFLESASPTVRRGRDAPQGDNPPNGVRIHYYLRENARSPVAISILDGSGQEIRRFSSQAGGRGGPKAEAGAQLLLWDMRYPGPFQVEGATYKHHEPQGPLAPPGTYTVRLTVDGQTYSQPFEIVKDPRGPTTPEQFAEKHRLLMAIRDKIDEIHRTVAEVRAARQQVLEATKAAAQQRQIQGPGDRLVEQLWQIEDELIQYRATTPKELSQVPPMLDDQLSTLAAFLESSDLPQTTQDREFYRLTAEAADRHIARFRELAKSELTDFQRLVGGQP